MWKSYHGNIKKKNYSQERDDRVKIKSLINSLTEKHSLIKQLDNEILELIESENDIEKGIEITSEFSDKLQIAFAKLENIFSEQNNNEKSSTVQTASLVTNNKPKPSRVWLPKLEMLKFWGDALQKTSFWDQYNATIHSSTAISNIEKFNYFKNLLTGSALESISSLSLTDSNYERAIDLLKERFNNPQILISSYMNVLTTLAKVTLFFFIRTSKLLAVLNFFFHFWGYNVLNLFLFPRMNFPMPQRMSDWVQ